MGVINLAPESFYEGSIVKTPKKSVSRALKMSDAGAKIIDLGAMSTAPGVKPISEKVEKKRLLPALEAVLDGVDVPISVDTYRAEVARAALEKGAQIVNDVSGLKADPELAQVVSDYNCSAILMAAKRRPGDVQTIQEIRQALQKSLEICKRHKINLKKISIDPGIGFGKGAKFDLRILANLKKLSTFGPPICVGISRKSFIGKVLGLKDPADRLSGSLAATSIAVLNGAKIIRTHDPQETIHAVRITEAIQSEGEVK